MPIFRPCQSIAWDIFPSPRGLPVSLSITLLISQGKLHSCTYWERTSNPKSKSWLPKTAQPVFNSLRTATICSPLVTVDTVRFKHNCLQRYYHHLLLCTSRWCIQKTAVHTYTTVGVRKCGLAKEKRKEKKENLTTNKDLHMLGEKMSPLKSIKGFKWVKDLMAVENLAAPPT